MHEGQDATKAHRPGRASEEQNASLEEESTTMGATLSTVHKCILAETYKSSGMLAVAELTETLDIPDLSAHIDDLRPYLQRVYIPGEPVHAGQTNGVALTVAGQDLMQAGLPPLLSDRAAKRLTRDVVAGERVA